MKGDSAAAKIVPVIVAARRSPIGKFNGSLRGFSASQIGSLILKQCLADLPKGSEGAIDEVIIGQVLTAGCGQNPARQTAIMAGLPEQTPSFTINKVCGSGLKAIHLGMQAILTGEATMVACGGQENMSQAPHFVAGKTSRLGQKMGDVKMQDTMLVDGLTCAFNQYHMGITAENVAKKHSLSREEQDNFALASQKKAIKAKSEKKFVEQTVKIGNLLEDEYINEKSSPEGLQKLKPAFAKGGTVTAGNASGLNDGAAFVILTTLEKAREMGCPILASCKAFASAGLDPKVMGLGPVPASRKCLQRAGWSIGDVDLIESNEAFASQSLGVAKELGFDLTKVNVNGGAIALGHPIGASGTRILVDLLYEMQRRNVKKGLATMCIGGGQGVALAVERTTAEAKL
ncbi:unnamed protein product [Amoebophrya sp. A25]|nr:unnamed protein product [Amoebophrya sp. A25]|eukprot:GSA25T00011946001.1